MKSGLFSLSELGLLPSIYRNMALKCTFFKKSMRNTGNISLFFNENSRNRAHRFLFMGEYILFKKLGIVRNSCARL